VIQVRARGILIAGVVRRDVLEVLSRARRHVQRRLVVRDLVQRADEPRHRILLRRPRAVRRRAFHGHVLPEGSLFCDADSPVGELAVLDGVVATLGDQKLDVLEQVGMPVDEHLCAGRAQLLVGVADEDDVASERDAAPFQGEHRHQMSDPFALHVERASPVDEALLDVAREGVDAPVLRGSGDDIHVMHEGDRLLAAISLQPRVKVRAASTQLGGVEYLNLEALLLEDILEPACGEQLVARRVRRIDPDILLQVVHGLVAEHSPVDRGPRLRRGVLGQRCRGGKSERAREKGESAHPDPVFWLAACAIRGFETNE